MPRVTAHLECAICLTPEVHKDWVVLVGCGHFFHNECIRRWCDEKIPGSERKQNSCPVCRVRIIRPSSERGRTEKENTRFRKICFDVKLADGSSSPVKGRDIELQTQLPRKRRVVDDSSEEDDAAGDNEHDARAGATESESDEDDSRPARRVERGALVERPAHERDNVEPGAQPERDAILQELEQRLAERETRIATLSNELHQVLQSNEALEAERTRAASEMRSQADRISALKADKRKLEKWCDQAKQEERQLLAKVDAEGKKTAKARETVQRLSAEVSLVKKQLSTLQATHAELEKTYSQAQDENVQQISDLKASCNRATRLFAKMEADNNKNVKRVEKRNDEITALNNRVQELERERAKWLNENVLDTPRRKTAGGDKQTKTISRFFAAAHGASSPASTQAAVSNGKDEISLLVEGADNPEIDDTDFDDLDALLPSHPRLPSTQVSKLGTDSRDKGTERNAQLPRDPLSAWRPGAASSASKAGSENGQISKRKQPPLSRGESWTDEALKGTVAVGGKKKPKLVFR